MKQLQKYDYGTRHKLANFYKEMYAKGIRLEKFVRVFFFAWMKKSMKRGIAEVFAVNFAALFVS